MFSKVSVYVCVRMLTLESLNAALHFGMHIGPNNNQVSFEEEGYVTHTVHLAVIFSFCHIYVSNS